MSQFETASARPGGRILLVRPIGRASTTGAETTERAGADSQAAGIERPPDSAVLGSKPLTEEEQRQVAKLKQRDQQVRTHEEAHKAAAGPLYRGGPTYKFKTGPDGRDYAVGGSVKIDTGPGRTPEETIQKAQQIRRAALAPADPSSTDRAVATKASRMEAEARAELNEQRADESSGPADATADASGPRRERSTADAFGPTSATLRLDVYA